MLLLIASILSASALAVECVTTSPPGAIPAAELVVLSSDATASATFCGGTAGYSSDTYMVSPEVVYIGTGNITAVGSEVDLGMFMEGDELVFSIYVRNTGYTYYTGEGSRNPDGIVHAAVTDLGEGEFHIGFEDLYGGGDLDYDDINIVISTEGIVITDHDLDDDGVPDDEDNCIADPNADQADYDGDGVGDVCDPCPYDATDDTDGDGVCDGDDNCADDFNDDQLDSDSDGAGDVCDLCPFDADDDLDADGVCGDEDNCVEVPNSDQADADLDGFGDVCDACPYDADDDLDADGVCGNEDWCPDTVLPDEAPTEELGVNRWADLDGDGVFDTETPKGRGPGRAYTIQDTAGCSCAQIIEEFELGEGHLKHGCSISAMDDWSAMVAE